MSLINKIEMKNVSKRLFVLRLRFFLECVQDNMRYKRHWSVTRQIDLLLKVQKVASTFASYSLGVKRCREKIPLTIN